MKRQTAIWLVAFLSVPTPGLSAPPNSKETSAVRSQDAVPLKMTPRAFDAVPYLRAILDAQKLIAEGRPSAIEEHLAHQTRASETFWALDPAVWSDPTNAHALLVFTLVGGNARVFRRAHIAGAMTGVDERLLGGIAALVTANTKTARELLLPLRDGSSHALLSAAVAVSLAPQVASTDPELALMLLEQARLAAPATLIAETADRRMISLHLDRGRPADALTQLRRYVWQFPHSLYAPEVIENAAVIIAKTTTPDAEKGLLSKLSQLPSESQPFEGLLLDLSREFILAGRLDVAQALVGLVNPRADRSAAGARRVQLYRLVVAVQRLESADRVDLRKLDRSLFSTRDAALLSAANDIVDHLPAPSVMPVAKSKVTVAVRPVQESLRRALAAIGAGQALLEVH